MFKQSWFKLSGYLLISIIVCALLWSGEQLDNLSFAQSPIPTMTVISDEVDIVNPPRPPTATPTRIPDDEPPVTTLVVADTPNSQNWYSDPISLTFTATDNWVGLGLTWHRLAGETDWQIYEYYYPPVVISEGQHTLYYYSEDDNNNLEPPRTTPLNIDLTAPTATHTLDGLYIPNGWYGSPVTVDLIGQDNLSGIDHHEINLHDGHGWQTVTATPVFSDTGHYTFTYRAIDAAGNVSAEEIITLDVDTTPPTTTHTISGTQAANGWYTSPVTITLTATDIGAGVFQILYRMDGGPAWWIYGGPFVVDSDGNHTLEYYATDRANNIETKHTVTFNIDQTPPVSAYPAITGIQGNNDWYVSPLTITLAATDTQGALARIEYDWRQSSWLTYTAPITLYNEGSYPLAYRAVDNSGHVEPTQWYTAQVDLSRPHLTMTTPPPLTLTHVILTDLYTATDEVSGLDSLTITLNGQTATTTPTLPLGTNTLTITATDKSGWHSTANQTIIVKGRQIYLPLILKPSPPPQ